MKVRLGNNEGHEKLQYLTATMEGENLWTGREVRFECTAPGC